MNPFPLRSSINNAKSAALKFDLRQRAASTSIINPFQKNLTDNLNDADAAKI